MFRTDIARFLQYFRTLSNSFMNIFAILQDFNGIFSKYSFNSTVLCGIISLESSTFADFKNRNFKTLATELQSFQFRKFCPHYASLFEKDTCCEGPRKRAKPRASLGKLSYNQLKCFEFMDTINIM